MTIRLEGTAPSARIREWVADSVVRLQNDYGCTPKMVTVQVGDNAAAERYARNQLKACQSVGIEAELGKFEGNIPKNEFLKYLASLGRDNEIDGIILQTPFPKSWRTEEILSALPSAKDVEGVHPENLGRLYLGESGIPLPCTAWSALSLLEWYGRSSFERTKCAVVGRSPNVGRAAAVMLMHKHGTVTVCHTRTSEEQLRETLLSAEVIIAAAGSPGLIKVCDLPPSAWVIDVGTNVDENGRLIGDVAPGADGAVAALSPVPGGVGPLTVSLLLVNLILCATRRRFGASWMLPNLGELRGVKE